LAKLGVIAACAAAVVIGFFAQSAATHTSTCSHYGAGYYVYIPNGKIYYEDLFLYGNGSGPHYHAYKSRKKTYINGVPGPFVDIHYHYGRSCSPHPF
jgi:hypothetical protein